MHGTVAASVIGDPQLDRGRLVADAHHRPRGDGVAHDVDQRRLDDAKCRGVDAGREVHRVAGDRELDRQARIAGARHQRADAYERRLGRERELLVAAAQDAEQAAQLA